MHMKNYFVPYSGKRPAALCINGHRVVILSTDRSAFDENLELLGADSLKCVDVGLSKKKQEQVLAKLARSVQGGVVIAPANIDVGDLIKNLSDELPWVQ